MKFNYHDNAPFPQIAMEFELLVFINYVAYMRYITTKLIIFSRNLNEIDEENSQKSYSNENCGD